MANRFPFALLVEGEWNPDTPKLKNKLIIYFQSKKSNGGDCSVQYDISDGQTALVWFEAAEVRQRVLEKQTHELKLGPGVLKLNVRLPAEDAKSPVLCKTSPGGPFKMDGIMNTNIDSVDSHLIMTPKRRGETGSGQQTILGLKKRRAIATGPEETPAAEVEKMPLAELQKEAEKESEQDEDKEDLMPKSVVLGNVQELNQEFLGMLVENILRGTSSAESHNFSVEIIPEISCAVVTCANGQDAQHFIATCSRNKIFKQKQLTVRPLEVTAKVKAENIPPNTTSDHLLLYFEKEEEIKEDVKILEEEQSAIITFKYLTAVSRVINKQHLIRKQPVRVFPYYESLGMALYGKDRPTWKLPDAFTENIDHAIWKYLQDNPESVELIHQDMVKHFCGVDLQLPAVNISPLPSLLQQRGLTGKLIRSWKEKAAAGFTEVISRFKSLELQIQTDAWAESVTEIRQTVSEEVLAVVPRVAQGVVMVAGLGEDVDRIGDSLKGIVDRITRRIEREKGSVTQELSLVPSIYHMMMLDGRQQKMLVDYPELKLTYSSESQKLIFFGLLQEVLGAKSAILQDVLSMRRRVVDIKQPVLEFLHEGDQEELTNTLFISQGICASLEIEKKRVQLLAKTEEALRAAEGQLETHLNCQCIDVEDSNVLLKPEWQHLVTRLKKTFNSPIKTVTVQTSDNMQVVVSGLVEPVKKVQEQLFDFLHKNSHINRILKARTVIIKFIQDHKKEKWLEEVKDKVKVDFKDETISLSGTRVHITKCMTLFENLISSAHCSDLTVAKPGAKKFFKDKESMYVGTAISQMGCLVQLVDEHDVLQDTGVGEGSKQVYQVQTPDGVEIAVCKADMCGYPVDAVVNAANDKLQHYGGLARALLDAAGPQMQDQCNQFIDKQRQLSPGDVVLTGAGGRLRCKHIIHAVGPHFDNSNPQSAVGLLNRAVKKSLKLAEREKYQSVAIPAISSGVFGFPLGLCADSIVKAIKEHCDYMYGDSTLKRIHLVNNDDRTVQAMEAAMQKVYGGSVPIQQGSQGGGLTRELDAAAMLQGNQGQVNVTQSQDHSRMQNRGTSQSVQTQEGLTITLLKGNIQHALTDVVVNTVSANLVLSHGAVSKAILNAAGPQLQSLLDQQAAGPANAGEVIVTNACSLKSKLVFHAVAPHWDRGQGTAEKVLGGIMDECLGQAEQRQQGSMTFSAIGTGNLGFPKALVASLMLESVLKFSKKRASKHLQEVVFILHPSDAPTIQAFTDEFNKRFQAQSASAAGAAGGSTQQSKGPFSKVTSPKSGMHETSVGGVVLQVVTGDITKETTDVIVNSSNDNFTFNSGVSKAILDAAGPNLKAECKQLGVQRNEGLIMTQPGNLQCKKIIHLVGHNDPMKIQKLVQKALQMCVQNNFTSISLPAFGTGQGGLQPCQVADAMLDAVVDMEKQTSQSSLQLVRIVIFQAPMLTEFHKSMQKRDGTDKQEKESAWSKIKSNIKALFTGDWGKQVNQQKGNDFIIEGTIVNPARFHICGESQADVDRAKQWIEDLITNEQAFELISDTMILSLSDKDQKRIQELQRTMGVSVRLEFKASDIAGPGEATLTVEGLSRDVLMATSEIQAMLRRVREKQSFERDVKLTSELVDWQYQQGGQYQSFDPLSNLHLEQALGRPWTASGPHVNVTLQGQVYKVTLPDGPAVDTSGNQMNVRRIDKLKVSTEDSLPQHWDAMPVKTQFKLYPLQSGSPEYNDVLGLFQTTCNNKVLKIERVQNPFMWKSYQVNKKKMEVRNGHQNNEKRLFHGTSEPTIGHINHHGFNRSYAGKNAAAFGNGTYFAVNAGYSSSNTYSVPNAQGQKHMYLCKVLTGEFTKGQQRMIIPPAKSNTTTDLYDTVVDNPSAPTIFVVFQDSHAYPEYLITFS